MKKFKIEITEILSKTLDIEANSEEEALEKVRILYKQEKVILDSNDFVGNEIKMINNEKIASVNGGNWDTKTG